MKPEWKVTPSGKLRGKGIGLPFEGISGPFNAITDVPGVTVGYSTIIEGNGALRQGAGPIRTGVTAIVPRPLDQIDQPLFAGFFSLNGNGELSGTHYIEETGKMALPVTITNTHSCGIARDATIKWAVDFLAERYHDDFALPVAAETYDGFLNDINGFHVEARHVIEAIDTARGGAVEEGSVGGGTGMKCFGFKAGSGTASRLVGYDGEEFTVGVFVQANFELLNLLPGPEQADPLDLPFQPDTGILRARVPARFRPAFPASWLEALPVLIMKLQCIGLICAPPIIRPRQPALSTSFQADVPSRVLEGRSAGLFLDRLHGFAVMLHGIHFLADGRRVFRITLKQCARENETCGADECR
jgi:hypothetical protein